MQLRKTEKVKVRQPLQKIEIAMDSSINIDDQIDTIKEELNIKEVVFLDNQEEQRFLNHYFLNFELYSSIL